MTTFGARLHAAMDERGPLCAGIDPHAGLLRAWGLTDAVDGPGAVRADRGRGARRRRSRSSSRSRRSSSGSAAAGVAVLERVDRRPRREAGALVLLDVKRGDIGSTTQAYADAYLDPASPIAADAITASPYLGFGSLDPMVDTARKHGTGVFVLALTSNPEGARGAARPHRGRGTRRRRRCSTTCASSTPAPPRSAPSARWSAPPSARPARTWPSTARCWRPGIGAQGGTADDVRRIFGDALDQVLPPARARSWRRT